MTVELSINGTPEHSRAAVGTTLLDVLRDELQLTGTKKGCVEGECGACTVLVDGAPIDSCLLAVHSVAGREVTTIEGLGPDDALSALQQAIVDAGGVQCGFCTPGIVMTLHALIQRHPHPTAAAIRRALAGNICRCTGYAQIVAAVLNVTAAADDQQSDDTDVAEGRTA